MILFSIALAVLGAVVPTAVYVLVLWWLDRYEKEPLWLFTLAFLWGAVPAAVLALIAELVMGLPLAGLEGLMVRLIQSTGIAPFVEEAVKGLALFTIFWFYYAEFDGVLDGVIYGAVIGFGFAMTENVVYFLAELAEGAAGNLGVLWVLRSGVFGLNHALFTAATGVGLGLARQARERWMQLLAPVMGLGVAVGLHMVHNLFSTLAEVSCWSIMLSLVSDWGGLVVLAVVIVLSWQQERRWLCEHLPEEVQAGVITAEEYGILSSAWGRCSSYWQALLQGGWAAVGARRRRLDWATELAFRKRQMAVAGTEHGAEAVYRLRAQLLRK